MINVRIRKQQQNANLNYPGKTTTVVNTYDIKLREGIKCQISQMSRERYSTWMKTKKVHYKPNDIFNL